MPEFKPTKSQHDAIVTRDRAVLVSAAAGSGKTKVLTERLLARISDDADVDSFLIITFTKAAAAELRSRIMDEISRRLAEEPDNRRLRRQSALCQRAQIGTIHSFCAAFLRENCHAAALSPDFKVIEEDRATAIKARVIERVMEAKYEKPDEGFTLLADTVGRGRDDSRLTELVINLHGKMQSHARPDKWAAEQIAMLENTCGDAGMTPWGHEILSAAKLKAGYWAERMEELALAARSEEKIGKAYAESVEATALSLRDFSRALNGGWDRAREFLPIAFPRLGALRNSPDPELSEYIKAVREVCKKAAGSLNELLAEPSDKLLADMKKTAPAMKALLKLTLDFDRAYSAEKRRRSEVDFADLEHLTAQLLTDEKGEPTELAKDTSRRYTEIMVDEYQDVNSVQDAIFRAVSKNGGNLFMVGDVKQSIYRFRLADPGIFNDKYYSYRDLDAAQTPEPVRILLQENFRSRREVIDGANHVFRTCMSQYIGEVLYDENAELRCGADYEGSVPVPELMLVDVNGNEEDETPDKIALEAAAVADKIRQMVDTGVRVADKGVSRRIRYSDIAILMRSANAVGNIYRRELTRAGVPVMNGQGAAFFESTEISTLLCLLAIIDNPHQDVPLIAVLRSPLFGFSADELSEIRSADRAGDFYTALIKTAGTNEKCGAFLSKLTAFRNVAPDMELGELLWHIYGETDMTAICSAMEGGEERCRNLMLMLEYAKRFESTGYRGLHRFVEWLNTLSERGEEPGRGVSGNAVQIMTVHKSKGLEFPVVFLCDTGRKFNRSDMRETVLVHPELGLGPKVTDTERGIEYPTLARNAIKIRGEREMLSEEMRLLYVALTRAKEQLIMTAGVKDPEAKMAKLRLTAGYPMSPEILMSAASPSLWLMYAALADDKGLMKVSCCHPESVSEEEKTENTPVASVNEETVEELRAKLAFKYAHTAAQTLPSKVTATELKNYEEPDEEALSIAPKAYRSFRMPDFAKADKPLTGAEKGTATHMVLQFMDYGRTGSLEDIRAEIQRLRLDRHLSDRQAEAVDAEAVLRLFRSDIGQRILKADQIRREFKFSLLCPAEKFFTGGEREEVLLQGVIDCCIEENGGITVVDYKTDRVKGEALYERAKTYAGQLRAYAIALERMTGKPVRECVLYFLHAGEEISVKNF